MHQQCMGFREPDEAKPRRVKLRRLPEPPQVVVPDELIVGSGDWKAISWCPAAATMSGWSEVRGTLVYCQIRCRRWSCPHCGRRRIASLAKKVAKAEPTKFVTLTVDPALHDTPADAFRSTARAIAPVITKLRRAYGPIEYLRILETTSKGWPHYHLAMQSGFIPQAAIADLWRAKTGAKIVDIRQVKKVRDVYWYMVKYLAKQHAVPWTKRRVSWTRKFFAACEKPEGLSLGLQSIVRDRWHPLHIMEFQCRGKLIRRLTQDAWEVLQQPPTVEPFVGEFDHGHWSIRDQIEAL